MASAAQGERTAGLLLIAAAGAAVLVANSPLAPAYQRLLHSGLGPLSVQHWIGDGLMALFFLLVGLEVKREWLVGRLSTWRERRLPIAAAAAGMAVPAVVFLLVSRGDPSLIPGCAVPAATDIAFALGVLALLGSRAPPALKLLLVALAIIDDVGAVAIIAIAYSGGLHALALGAAALLFGAMLAMNRAGVRCPPAYLLGFALLWIAVHESGVHATIAGVLAALAVPLRPGERGSTLERIERPLHPLVMFGIVPLFGFASAGVALGSSGALLAPLTLAVALGLFLGKQLGVYGAVRLFGRPEGVSWPQLYGGALLCGIGFTMSLFIGALAFVDPVLVEQAKLGTLVGSLLSGGCGYAVLRFCSPSPVPASRGDQQAADEIFYEDD
ncbi:Na+/H+ antiporter NhaA [Sphingomonas ginkgonis]|uniref:Na(+)/H(+) antiporter NhaA n=1 Tax=Sphingomonas ginkgonis TaxID=2315330 RepID=A0A3R9YK66_9SPHN|nr:Na+/H+ antiporter NhaA [Sphingomonas ginkgonis]RST29615.1 Na+/H+ antiporter NhaA [Sphingomonas ginkgonis]